MSDVESNSDGTRRRLGHVGCPHCDYDLHGRERSGVCPECGEAYSPGVIAFHEDVPSVLEICLRFGWPVVIMLALTFLLPDYVSIPGACIHALFWVGSWPVVLINTIVQYVSLGPRTAPLDSQKVATKSNRRAVVTIVTGAMVSIIALVVSIGACLRVSSLY